MTISGRRQVQIAETFVNVMNQVSFELAGEVVDTATEKFNLGEYQEVYLLYNSFRTAVTQIVHL